MSLTVLIVDDDTAILLGLTELLSDDLPGSVVTTATDGRAAINMLDERGPFDIVLCDLQLPDMSGVDVALAARRQPWGIAAVVGCISLARTRHEVFDFAISKPFEVEDLVRAINVALAQRRSA